MILTLRSFPALLLIAAAVGGCRLLTEPDQGMAPARQTGGQKVYRIDNVRDLDALALHPADADARRLLDILREGIRARGDTSRFLLGFRRFEPRPPLVRITDSDQLALDTVAEAGGLAREPQQRDEPEGCTHNLPPTLEAFETFLHPERYRGMQCGNIATLHSLVKLGLLKTDEAYRGDHLDQDHVRALNHAHHFETRDVGMTSGEIQQAHRTYSLPDRRVECVYPLASRIDAPAVEHILRAATGIFNTPQPSMDCSLEIRGDYDGNGKPRLSHVEHITSVRRLPGGNWEIQTVDGFNQGASDATIPRAPGRNTWEFGRGMGRLKTAAAGRHSPLRQLVYEHLTVNCCYVEATTHGQ